MELAEESRFLGIIQTLQSSFSISSSCPQLNSFTNLQSIMAEPDIRYSMPNRRAGRSGQIVSTYCSGQWLPQEQAVLDEWVRKLIKKVIKAKRDAKGDALKEEIKEHLGVLHPPVQDLKDLIENDSEVNMFFHQMFSQVKQDTDPTGDKQVKSYQEMLLLINHILTTAPEFNKSGLVGFPINAILNWSMGTIGGYAAFLNDKVNTCFKNILNHWSVFLQSPESAYVLNDDPESGWFGRDASDAMPNFVKEYQCDPRKPHHGFKSWDDFFIREFRPGVRQVAAPDDHTVIANACESTPFKLQVNVKRRSRFWIKKQPYSLAFMLANDPYVDLFVGGTVYQAFLSALNYHRWHSPVSGRIIKCYKIDGSYYSEALCERDDPAAPDRSQGYLTEVAARALIFIQADNAYIGLMGFLAVGMAEVSSCEITVFEGQHVKKGEEIGMFHFGGSTHCLIFRKGVDVGFGFEQGLQKGKDPGLILVKDNLATVPKNIQL